MQIGTHNQQPASGNGTAPPQNDIDADKFCRFPDNTVDAARASVVDASNLMSSATAASLPAFQPIVIRDVIDVMPDICHHAANFISESALLAEVFNRLLQSQSEYLLHQITLLVQK